MASEADNAFFRPLWRRVALLAVVAVWFGYEAMFVGEPMWMMISGGMFAYGVWTYIIRWREPG